MSTTSPEAAAATVTSASCVSAAANAGKTISTFARAAATNATSTVVPTANTATITNIGTSVASKTADATAANTAIPANVDNIHENGCHLCRGCCFYRMLLCWRYNSHSHLNISALNCCNEYQTACCMISDHEVTCRETEHTKVACDSIGDRERKLGQWKDNNYRRCSCCCCLENYFEKLHHFRHQMMQSGCNSCCVHALNSAESDLCGKVDDTTGQMGRRLTEEAECSGNKSTRLCCNDERSVSNPVKHEEVISVKTKEHISKEETQLQKHLLKGVNAINANASAIPKSEVNVGNDVNKNYEFISDRLTKIDEQNSNSELSISLDIPLHIPKLTKEEGDYTTPDVKHVSTDKHCNHSKELLAKHESKTIPSEEIPLKMEQGASANLISSPLTRNEQKECLNAPHLFTEKESDDDYEFLSEWQERDRLDLKSVWGESFEEFKLSSASCRNFHSHDRDAMDVLDMFHISVQSTRQSEKENFSELNNNIKSDKAKAEESRTERLQTVKPNCLGKESEAPPNGNGSSSNYHQHYNEEQFRLQNFKYEARQCRAVVDGKRCDLFGTAEFGWYCSHCFLQGTIPKGAKELPMKSTTTVQGDGNIQNNTEFPCIQIEQSSKRNGTKHSKELKGTLAKIPKQSDNVRSSQPMNETSSRPLGTILNAVSINTNSNIVSHPKLQLLQPLSQFKSDSSSHSCACSKILSPSQFFQSSGSGLSKPKESRSDVRSQPSIFDRRSSENTVVRSTEGPNCYKTSQSANYKSPPEILSTGARISEVPLSSIIFEHCKEPDCINFVSNYTKPYCYEHIHLLHEEANVISKPTCVPTVTISTAGEGTDSNKINNMIYLNSQIPLQPGSYNHHHSNGPIIPQEDDPHFSNHPINASGYDLFISNCPIKSQNCRCTEPNYFLAVSGNSNRSSRDSSPLIAR